MANILAGVNLPSTLKTYTDADHFPLLEDSDLLGSHRSVPTLAGRDAIFPERRKEGMTVYCIEDGVTYQLIGGITNSDWHRSNPDAPPIGKPTLSGWAVQGGTLGMNSSSVAYGNGIYVAVSTAGAVRLMTSTNGIFWTQRTPPLTGGFGGICFGNDLFVAASYSAGTFMYSADGITWDTGVITPSMYWRTRGLFYGNGLFVAVGQGDSTHPGIATSTNGIDWQVSSQLFALEYRSIAYGNGTYVIVGEEAISGKHILTSPDGLTWTEQTIAIPGWTSVCFGNDIFVAVSREPGVDQIAVSSDGVTWMTYPAPSAELWQSVCYAEGFFVAVGLDGASMFSTNGVTWELMPTSTTNSFRGVCYGDGKFVAVALGAEAVVITAEVTLPHAYITEAPLDGYQYIRRDGEWAELIVPPDTSSPSVAFNTESLLYSDSSIFTLEHSPTHVFSVYIISDDAFTLADYDVTDDQLTINSTLESGDEIRIDYAYGSTGNSSSTMSAPMGIPDYTARNLLTPTEPNMWVAPDNGYMYASIFATSDTEGTMRVQVFVNGGAACNFIIPCLAGKLHGFSDVLPVKEGDIITANADTFEDSNIVSLTAVSCTFLPCAASSFPTDSVAFVPDYANKDTVNRISPTSDTWISDKDGFVYIGAGSAAGGFYIKVNDIDVKIFASTAVSNMDYSVMPIKKGDKIQIVPTSGSLSAMACYFIPPVAVTVSPTLDESKIIHCAEYTFTETDTSLDALIVNTEHSTIYALRSITNCTDKPQGISLERNTAYLTVIVSKTTRYAELIEAGSTKTWKRTKNNLGWQSDWVFHGPIAVDQLVHSPHEWVVGTEYDFGDGSYGVRFTGNITAAAGTLDHLTFINTTYKSIVSFSGYWQMGANDALIPVGQTYSDTPGVSGTVLTTMSQLYLRGTNHRPTLSTYTMYARDGITNSAYDVCIRYTKP